MKRISLGQGFIGTVFLKRVQKVVDLERGWMQPLRGNLIIVSVRMKLVLNHLVTVDSSVFARVKGERLNRTSPCVRRRCFFRSSLNLIKVCLLYLVAQSAVLLFIRSFKIFP